MTQNNSRDLAMPAMSHEMRLARNLFLAWALSIPVGVSVQDEARKLLEDKWDNSLDCYKEKFWANIPAEIRQEMKLLLGQTVSSLMMPVNMRRRRQRALYA